MATATAAIEGGLGSDDESNQKNLVPAERSIEEFQAQSGTLHLNLVDLSPGMLTSASWGNSLPSSAMSYDRQYIKTNGFMTNWALHLDSLTTGRSIGTRPPLMASNPRVICTQIQLRVLALISSAVEVCVCPLLYLPGEEADAARYRIMPESVTSIGFLGSITAALLCQAANVERPAEGQYFSL